MLEVDQGHQDEGPRRGLAFLTSTALNIIHKFPYFTDTKRRFDHKHLAPFLPPNPYNTNFL